MKSIRARKKPERNNRINIVTAVVFLLLVVFVYQLYKIQVSEHDYFSVLASRQHNVHSKLLPDRGEILVRTGEGGEGLYPIATNKDFALIFAIPKDVDEPLPLAEKLYSFFDQEEIEEEVREYFEKKDKEKLMNKLREIPVDLPEEERGVRSAEIEREFESKRQTEVWQEEREEEIEEEIEKREEGRVDYYVEILSREDDPYRVLERKVEKEVLFKLYDFLWPEDQEKNFTYNDLFIRNGQVYYQDGERRVRVRIEGVSHSVNRLRYYPEENIGSHFLGFVNFYDLERRGNYGLEGFFNRDLYGELGFVKSESEKDEDTIVINNRSYKKPVDGNDFVLSIVWPIQFYVCQELDRAVRGHRADGGSVVVVSPETGEIIAMCSSPSFNPNEYNEVDDIKIYNNPVIFEDYEPGSVFKTITMASSLDAGAITPRTTYEDGGSIKIDNWTIRNSDYSTHGPHGLVDMNYVLRNSLNTGSIWAMEQMGHNLFSDYLNKFGFGSRTGIELEGEGSGDIKNLRGDNIRRIYAATASYGQGITVTPLQLVMAFAAIANEGVLMQPHIVKEIIKADGEAKKVEPVTIRRVISEEAAALTSGMMVNVVEDGHASGAKVDGYYVGGKTGTAQVASSGGYGRKTIHTFAGTAPIDDPKFTMLVKLNDPKDVRFAASSAAPLFGKLADFILNHYQISKNR